jgi:hypothetical protein
MEYLRFATKRCVNSPTNESSGNGGREANLMTLIASASRRFEPEDCKIPNP